MSASFLLGPAACLGSAAFWALAANVYTRAARVSSPSAVNLARASLSFPFFLLGALALAPGGLALVGPGRAGWLVLSVVGSYVLGDALFLASARLLGVPVALAVSSIYPIWSALAGALFLGQRVSPAGYAGVVLVVAGVVAVVVGDGRVGIRRDVGLQAAAGDQREREERGDAQRGAHQLIPPPWTRRTMPGGGILAA